jgi:hypothetical protein
MGRYGPESTSFSLFAHPRISPAANGASATRRAYSAVSHQAALGRSSRARAAGPICRLSLDAIELAEFREHARSLHDHSAEARQSRDRLRLDHQSRIFLSQSAFRSRVYRSNDVRSRPSTTSSALRPPHTICDEFFNLSVSHWEERPNQQLNLIARLQDLAFDDFLWFFWPPAITAGFRSRSG